MIIRANSVAMTSESVKINYFLNLIFFQFNNPHNQQNSVAMTSESVKINDFLNLIFFQFNNPHNQPSGCYGVANALDPPSNQEEAFIL